MRRIWQALITEARFRGYRASVTRDRRDLYDRGQLIIEIGWDRFPITLYGDHRTPLLLRLVDPRPGRRRQQDTWVDTDRRRLEATLGEVLTRIEQHADLLLAAREDERRRETERQARQHLADAAATQQFTEDHRRGVLAQRLDAVRLADDAVDTESAAGGQQLPRPARVSC